MWAITVRHARWVVWMKGTGQVFVGGGYGARAWEGGEGGGRRREGGGVATQRDTARADTHR